MSKGLILIIDDDATWQTSLTSLLERHQFDVVNAFDYVDALHQLETVHPRPILCTVDLHLPITGQPDGYDGIPLLDELAKQMVYALVLSDHTRKTVDATKNHPAVIDIVDKLRFTDANYEPHFIRKVEEAILKAQADRWSEGQFPEQQSQLHQSSRK